MSLGTPARSPALEAAFQSMVDVAETVNLEGIDDPQRQWLAILRQMMLDYGGVGSDFDLSDIIVAPVSAGGVPAEWVCRASSSNSRRIVYIHGGAWAAGSPLGYRALAATLARLSGASILMVDYRLAPEHKYPAGLDDCVAAYLWALDNGPGGPDRDEDKRDPTRIVSLAGDSAGGNLAAATALRLARDGARLPDRLALIAGTLDNHRNDERIGLDDPICTQEAFAASNTAYLTPGIATDDPFVSPVFAPDALIAKLPPTLIQVSAIEALLWDSRRFAERLEANSVRHAVSIWPGMPHVWHAFLTKLPDAALALQELGDFLAPRPHSTA